MQRNTQLASFGINKTLQIPQMAYGNVQSMVTSPSCWTADYSNNKKADMHHNFETPRTQSYACLNRNKSHLHQRDLPLVTAVNFMHLNALEVPNGPSCLKEACCFGNKRWLKINSPTQSIAVTT